MSIGDRQAALRARLRVRSEVVSVRFTSDDLDTIEQAADHAGELISDYVRRVVVAAARSSEVEEHP